MRRNRNISRPGERGVVVILVAIFLLFVVGAMAVLAVDAVTFYTARSEAQLAADGAALAGARVLANSGMTSNPSNLTLASNAEALARSVAAAVATQNKVGGRLLTAGDVSTATTVVTGFDPRISVQITSNLPTFFARIWGQTQVTVSASATAEAYNSSGLAASFSPGPPIAPVCVKPWLLPNLDPTTTGGGGPAIFNPSGGIVNQTLVGSDWQLQANCGDCGVATPNAGRYYPAAIDPGPGINDLEEFPVPTKSLPSCSIPLTADSSQLAVAGCVQQPISCGANANYKIDLNTQLAVTRDTNTLQAVKCLIHDNGVDGESDSIDSLSPPSPPFQFVAGSANPIAGAVNKSVQVSDSLVTIPVFDSSGGVGNPVQVVGFVQAFLNPLGTTVPGPTITARIINMAGCGTTATGQPVLGTGTSAIAVRLVAGP